MSRVELRRASAADSDRLCELMGRVPMAGDLRVAADRQPSYFALYEMQASKAEVYVAEEDGHLLGAGTVLVRDAFVGGERTRVGYLGDLRSAGFTRRSLAFPAAFGEQLAEIKQRHDCSLFFTCLMEDNRAAIQALDRRAGRPSRRGQPRYRRYRRFEGVCVHFLRRGRLRSPPGYHVERARVEDLPEVEALLAADHRRRPFGYDFARGELDHRLACWPGYSLDETWLCRRQGRLVGVTTAWDAASVRRYQVAGYSRRMRVMNAAYNGAARIFGSPPLPSVGESFRYFFLANLSVLDDDPLALRALIERVYAERFDDGYQFFMVPLYEGDPLAGAFTRARPWGTFLRRLRFLMYTVSPPGEEAIDPGKGRPGFEIALA